MRNIEGWPKDLDDSGAVDDARVLLAGLFEHAPLACQIYRADGRLLGTNQAFRDLFGAEPPRGYNLLSDSASERRQGFRNQVPDAFSGRVVRFEADWYRPCEICELGPGVRQSLGLQIALRPLRDQHGSVSHVIVHFEDVAAELELRTSAESLRQSEERFRATFDQAAVGVAHVAPDGRWLEVNQRLCDIVGYEREELLHLTFQDITYPSDLDADLELVRQVLAGKIETYSMDKRYVRKDAALVWIELTVSLIRHPTGEPKYFISVIQDISARKRAEEELANTTTELKAEIGERERIERALRESEKSLATTLDSIGDAVIATDTQGCVVRMNPIAETLTAWKLENARGRHLSEVFQIFNEGTGEPAESPVDRVLREGLVVGLANHTVLVTRNGATLPIADSGAPIRDHGGAIRGVVLVFRDQTGERLAEQALRESEARKGAILEAALDCIVSIDRQGLITEFNPAAEQTFGYTRDEAIGKALVELLIPSSLRELHREGFRRYLQTGAGRLLGRRVETMALRADGTEFPVELAVVPTRSHETLFFTGYIRDITERRNAVEALRVSEARFRHLAEAGIIGIIVADTLGNIHEANDAFLKIVGFSREDLLSGRVRWADMTPPEWRSRDEAAVSELAATGIAQAWEKEYIRKDGTRAPILVGVAMLDAPSCIAFVLDLSDRKRAEEGRSRALTVAEQESAERGRAEAALRQTEEQLRQSQKMEAIGILSGSIAHDFNNLLSVILGHADLLLSELRPADPMRADLEQIGRAGRQASDLTRQLLAFSRKQVLQPKVIDLNDVMSSIVPMLQRVIGEDIEMSVLLGPDLSAVCVDPGQIEQVLLNLVVNAREAMPRGGYLAIETRDAVLEDSETLRVLDVSAGSYVVLSVRDTGTGMDHATRARIFEPFFTTKEKGKGTGLGLSTVYGIVRQSGGSISVRSELGHGTTFDVYLPHTEATPGPTERPGPHLARLRGSETILLVEDDGPVRALVVAVLQRNGYDVLDASTGGDALLICEQQQGPIHLLLTDVVMPRMSGRELWERLSPMRPEMKVLFMSGYTDDAILHHGVSSEEFEFAQKPLTPNVLLAKLRAVLDGESR